MSVRLLVEMLGIVISPNDKIRYKKFSALKKKKNSRICFFFVVVATNQTFYCICPLTTTFSSLKVTRMEAWVARHERFTAPQSRIRSRALQISNRIHI